MVLMLSSWIASLEGFGVVVIIVEVVNGIPEVFIDSDDVGSLKR